MMLKAKTTSNSNEKADQKMVAPLPARECEFKTPYPVYKEAEIDQMRARIVGTKRQKKVDGHFELNSIHASQSLSSIWDNDSNLGSSALYEPGQTRAFLEMNEDTEDNFPFASREEMEVGRKELAMIKNKEAARKYR
jgi:hypothetical protein